MTSSPRKQPKKKSKSDSSETGVKGKTAQVRISLNRELKDEAEATLAEMGLTLTDAFKILLRRVAGEQRIPFEIYAVVTPRERAALAR